MRSITFVTPHQRPNSGGVYAIHRLAVECSRWVGVTLAVDQGEPQRVPGLRVVPLAVDALPDADALLVPADFGRLDELLAAPRRKGTLVLLLQGYGEPGNPVVTQNLRSVRRVMAGASWLVADARREGCAAELFRYGFDRDVFHPPADESARREAVGLIASATGWKGTADAVEALAVVRAERPGLEIVTAGDTDPGLPDARHIAAPPGGRPEIAELMRTCQVFVAASWEEGFGLPGVEALACGAALATTDTKGSREYASHEETALVSPPRAPADLAQNVLRLLADAELRRRLVDEGQRRIAATYPPWERAGEPFLASLARLLAAPIQEHGPVVPRAGFDASYVALLKQALTGGLHQDVFAQVPVAPEHWPPPELARDDIVPARRLTGHRRERLVGEGRGGWPLVGETMVGRHRLENVQHCVEEVLREGVPGDLIEAGVWRGGVGIFMRALLKVHGETTRAVYLADSFAGLPPPDEAYPADSGDPHHTFEQLAVDEATVRANFERYGLLDDQVRFVAGWFKDTLPALADRTWAVIRLDGDMYESTMTSLRHLYPRLSPGGYVIVDDYGALESAARAVEDFRAAEGITEPIERVDWTGAFWRRRR